MQKYTVWVKKNEIIKYKRTCRVNFIFLNFEIHITPIHYHNIDGFIVVFSIFFNAELVN